MTTSAYPGLFIAIEGADGSGKTTAHKLVIEMFRKYLQDTGVEVIGTREIGGSPVAEKLRDLITGKDEATKEDPTHAGTRLLMVLASRLQHIYSKVFPQVNKGNIVISDRCFDSTWVYQGVKDGQQDELEIIENLKALRVLGQRPDYTFFLDVSPEVSMQRTGDHDAKGETFNVSGGLVERTADIERYRQRMASEMKRTEGKGPVILRLDADRSLSEITQELDKMVHAIAQVFSLKRQMAHISAAQEAQAA